MLAVIRLIVSSICLGRVVVAQVLAPTNDIVFPSTSSASDPLQYGGANSPYNTGK